MTTTTTPRAPSRKRPAPPSSNIPTASAATNTPSANATAGDKDDWAEPPKKKATPSRQDHRDGSR